ncbi:MAG TPA: Wzz/FepE/Etk N-terminal domain-containing protein [Steroidobacter sp.]
MNSTTERFINDDDTVDLSVLIARLWAGRWWIIASVVVFTAIAAAIAFTSTRIYRASVVLVPANAEGADGMEGALGQLGGLASLAGLKLGSSGLQIEEALAVLRSREFTEKFISDQNLMPVLYEAQWDKKEQRWLPDTKPPTPAQAYKYFNKGVRTIVQDKKTSLVTMHIDWKDAQQAAQWANELVARLNSEMRQRAIAQANASLGYLEKELGVTSVVGTRDSINRLIESQIKQRMLATVTQEYTFRIVDKALPSDPDDPFRPNKLLLLIGGVGLGGILGICGVLFASVVASGRYSVSSVRQVR